jgi:signal transduction histidine kinase
VIYFRLLDSDAHQGGITLRVGRVPSAECPILDFSVEDTGAGIATEELDQVFEAFVQTESSRRSKEGTGLGLAGRLAKLAHSFEHQKTCA